MNTNLTFSRLLLREVMVDVKAEIAAHPEHYGNFKLSDAWVYCSSFGWEFHGPRGLGWEFRGAKGTSGKTFYWHGEADNAYHARALGWQSWLRSVQPED